MTFRSFYWRWFRLLFAIHGFLGLFAGYWDTRLSDAFLKSGQMSRIHYYRALQFHLILALVITALLALYLARKHWRRTQEMDRIRVVPPQIALALSYLLFLILGIKLHLVWLDTHLLDPEGLFWTGAVLVGAIILYALSSFVLRRMAGTPSARRYASLAFLVLSVATLADAYRHQHRTHRGLEKPDAPNVLLIVADTLRSDHVSAYGYNRKTTPILDRLAAEGALYEKAFSASPWTTPSHAAMFTGQYPSRNGVDGKNIYLNPEEDTIAGYLTRHGFQTAGFINNVYIRRQTGIGRGFQQYEEFWGRNEAGSLPLLAEFMTETLSPRQDTGAAETNASIATWLNDDWNPAHPFFIFAHYMEPHAPYGVPETFISQYLPAGVTPQSARKVNQDPELYVCNKISMGAKDFEILNALYDNDVYYLDQQIGKLLDAFRARGILDKTLIIFVSDHGEHFGDHGLMSHELSVYDPLIHVPLILRYPATIPAGTRISGIVQTVDLFPSILKFTNVRSVTLPLQGSSLLPADAGNNNQRFAFAEYNNARAIDKIERRFPGYSSPVFKRKTLRAIRSVDLKLIVGDDGTRELYNTRNDPGETVNLYSHAPNEARILEDVLMKWRASFTASKFYRQEEVSKEALDELKSLGYVQ